MFNLYKYLKLIDEYSEEKVKSKIFCSWYGDTIKILLVAIFIDAFFFPILTRYSYNYYLIFYFFIILGMFYYLVTRKAGLGLTENRLVYIRFKRLGMGIKKIEEIPFAIPEDEQTFDTFFAKDDEEVQQWKSVLEAIKHLPDQQKQVLYLYYIKELSHKEIGELLGINPQSSMNTLAKSIKKLREALNGHPDSLLLFFIIKSLLWLH